MTDQPDPQPAELQAENAQLHQWHAEDRDALVEMRATIERLRGERRELGELAARRESELIHYRSQQPAAVPSAPADADLRERIERAIHADLLAHRVRRDQGLLGIVPRLTDAVLVALAEARRPFDVQAGLQRLADDLQRGEAAAEAPAPTDTDARDRAAVLAEVEQMVRKEIRDCGYPLDAGCDFCNGATTVLEKVRRMTVEVQQADGGGGVMAVRLYRVLVTGSRDWDDVATIGAALEQSLIDAGPRPVLVVHGACPSGADWHADRYARWMRGKGCAVDVEPHPANWQINGRRAGFIRNAHMVNLGADLCLAFIKDGSRGASHTAALAEQAGVPVRRFTN